MSARLGVVLDWLCTAVAVGVLRMAYATYDRPNTGGMSGGALVGIAAATWLFGKALRFILARIRSEEPTPNAAGFEREK